MNDEIKVCMAGCFLSVAIGLAFAFAVCKCCCDHADHCAPASCCPPEIVKRIEALEVKVFHSGAVEEEAK